MARYINVDLTEAEIADKVQEITANADVFLAVRKVLGAFPAADVQEVTRGEWIFSGQKKRGGMYRFFYHCSRCFRVECRDLDDPTMEDIYPYCHCGAKMDGKENKK